MNFLKKLFGIKPRTMTSAEFWDWFQTKEKAFHHVVKNQGDVEGQFLNVISPKLAGLRDGYFCLIGMLDPDTVELVITADGIVKEFVFVEELVEAAPSIKGWKFTAHKPAHDIADLGVKVHGFEFNKENLRFEPIVSSLRPDEIEITVIHPAFNDDNRNEISNGVYIFLDAFLGEINFATTIDHLNIESKGNTNELVPIDKLKDYLIWRQKEFIEKYDGVRFNTESDNYSGFEAMLENGNPLVAIMNTELLKWDRKASHPWILKIEIEYTGSGNGMPDSITFDLMNEFEDALIAELRDSEGYLNVGRQTADGSREIYFACKDFRKSSKVASDMIAKYSDRLKISFEIYKDKYWRTFERYVNS
ncbi:MAG: DUF695 domain-containing protein [Chryseolinea sp.]